MVVPGYPSLAFLFVLSTLGYVKVVFSKKIIIMYLLQTQTHTEVLQILSEKESREERESRYVMLVWLGLVVLKRFVQPIQVNR